MTGSSSVLRVFFYAVLFYYFVSHFSLRHDKFVIYAAVFQEFVVRAEFGYLSVIKHKQTVGPSLTVKLKTEHKKVRKAVKINDMIFEKPKM